MKPKQSAEDAVEAVVDYEAAHRHLWPRFSSRKLDRSALSQSPATRGAANPRSDKLVATSTPEEIWTRYTGQKE
jgi:hypothetical protein